jgi:hypothetical protein
MSRKYSMFAEVGLAILALSFGMCLAADPPPANLPLLPPPEKAPEPTPITPATLVPVEFRIAIEDLEKQMLRSLVQKIDPKAEPVLPIVVKGNEREFALGAEAGPPEVPKPIAEAGRENAQEMPANRPQLIPRQPGAFPRLDRLAARPLVAGMVGRILGTVDLTYRIEIRSFKLSIAGNIMTCEVGGGFHCEGKATAQGPVATPPNVRDVGIKMTVTKNLEWNENGKLELKEGTSKVWIDPDAPLVGFPRLDIERVVRLNGLLVLMGGTLDRELMKRLSTENLPDLAVIVPTMKLKMPFLAVSELTAYTIRGDDKHVYFPFVVGLVPANKKTTDTVKIATKSGPAPEAKVKGRIIFNKDGKPEVKLDPAR